MSFQIMLLCFECEYLHSLCEHEVTFNMTCEKCGEILEETIE